MIRKCRLGAVLVLFVAARAPAQDRPPSHIPVQPPGDPDLERLFRDRLRDAQRQAGISDLFKQIGHDRRFDNVRLRQILLDNPELMAWVQRLGSGDAEARRQFDELVRQAVPGGRLPPGLSREEILSHLENLFRQSYGPDALSQFGQLSQSQPAGPPVDPAERAARQEIARQIAEFAERFPKDHLPDSLRNSPAMKDFFRDLSKSATAALRNPNGAEGLDAQLARLKTRWRKLGDWLPKEIPTALRKLHMPDVTRMIGPRRHGLPTLEATASLPRPTAPRVDLGPVTNVILVLGAVAVAVAAIWRFRGGRFTTAAGGGRALGPWPVDPARVASRVDLIRAFEYLSLLRCGEPARSWHHRAIAACLGGTDEGRREAAARLAALYEQARYAPGGRAEADWTEARGPLALLSGAG